MSHKMSVNSFKNNDQHKHKIFRNGLSELVMDSEEYENLPITDLQDHVISLRNTAPTIYKSLLQLECTLLEKRLKSTIINVPTKEINIEPILAESPKLKFKPAPSLNEINDKALSLLKIKDILSRK